jgi:Co/Zn/Cd efflux system component
MRRTSTFDVPKMDCPSEERMIRLALEPLVEVHGLQFDLEGRCLTVTHEGSAEKVLSHLEPLGFGARLTRSEEAEDGDVPPEDPVAERRVLRQLLTINAGMFVAELGVGFYAQSTGLIADSLDMLADAMVYGLSLYAVGRAVTQQKRAAHASGWLQIALAMGALAEVVRRAIVGSEPVEVLMIGMAAIALVANLTCVALLARHREGGVHLKASWIFSTNDALANLGVIVAGVLVLMTDSALPDLAVGAGVGVLVMGGGLRILRL